MFCKNFFKIFSIILIQLFCCASVFSAERYILSVVKTQEQATNITWDKNGQTFAYSERNNIIVRDYSGHTVIQNIYTGKPDINFLEFSPTTEGSYANQLASLHRDGNLDFRILPDPNITITTQTEKSQPTVMNFSNNGNFLAIGNLNGTVLLYIQAYLTQRAIPQVIGNFGEPIKTLCFSKDNKYLVIGAADNAVYLWDISASKLLRGYAYHSNTSAPILMTSDSQTIIMPIGDSSIGFFDLNFTKKNFYTTYRTIKSIQISSDDRYLIILTDDNVFSFYDLITKEIKKYIPTFNDTPILSYSFNHECSRLAISHEDHSLYVLDVNTVIRDKEEKPGEFIVSQQEENYQTFDFVEEKTPEVIEQPKPKIEEKEEQLSPPVIVDPIPIQRGQTPPIAAQPQIQYSPSAGPVQTTSPASTVQQTVPQTVNTPQVNIIQPQVQQPEQPQQEQPKQQKKEKKPQEIKPYNQMVSIDVAGRFLPSPFIGDVGVTISYLNFNHSDFIYFGLAAEPFFAFPEANFPYSYPDGTIPKMVGGRVYIPIGVHRVLYEPYNLEGFIGIGLGATMSTLWNGKTGTEAITSSLYPSFYFDIKTGLIWKYLNVYVFADYDSLYMLNFGGGAGGSIKFSTKFKIDFSAWAEKARATKEANAAKRNEKKAQTDKTKKGNTE